MVEYRSFRNDDPPALAEIWNECFTGRGAVQLRNSSPLERHAYCKPYFDPAGLTVAVEDGRCVGFAHAGFGANDKETALAHGSGVVCAIGVRPSHRRRGIGSELVRRSETYLRKRGARKVFAGQIRPFNPFYMGLYGGSDLPGFLASDKDAAPFFEFQGYQPWETCLVLQRRLALQVNPPDPRFVAHRKRFEVQAMPRASVGTWWQECVLPPQEFLEFRLEESATKRVAARALLWEMEGFTFRWGLPSTGIIDLQVRDDLRRQGVGKFLLVHILRYLQDQYYGLCEVQTLQANQPAIKLFQGVGFEQVDVGRVFRKEHAPLAEADSAG